MKKTRELVILGATSNGDLFELIEACNRVAAEPFDPVAFLDDDSTLHGGTAHGLPVKGALELAKEFEDAWFLNAIGAPEVVAGRPEILARAGIPAARFATFIHPQAIVSVSARIGNGCLIFAGAVIGADVIVGDFSDVMSNAVISHGCTIGDCSFVASGAMLGGEVRIGEACFLGLNCSVRERLLIGSRSILGQGSVILNDVLDGSVMAGNPARKIRDTLKS